MCLLQFLIPTVYIKQYIVNKSLPSKKCTTRGSFGHLPGYQYSMQYMHSTVKQRLCTVFWFLCTSLSNFGLPSSFTV